jgi:hypothetical protein
MSAARAPRIDALAGGPVVYPASVRQWIAEVAEGPTPTYRIYRQYDEKITSSLVR